MANYNSRHTGAEIDNCVDNYQSAAQVTAAITAAKLAMFPVGSVYITINDNNPALFIGGTWVRIGQGRTLVGVGTGTDNNETEQEFQPNESGGEYTHTLSVSEMPNHTHVHRVWVYNGAYDNQGGARYGFGYSAQGALATGSTFGEVQHYNENTGGSLSHNNIQPYITVFFWQRTA